MTVLATIVVLGVLIFVHELGHFIAAKAVGVEVQRFSIGLGPRVLGVQYGETEYVLSAVPLGGYVKMGGMGDEEVTARLEGGAATEPRVATSRDFDTKPIWARTLVISAGVIMNMLFAFGVYTANAAFWGSREASETRVGKVYEELLPGGASALASIPIGARLTEVGSREVRHWGDVRDGLNEAPPGPLEVRWRDPAGSATVHVPDAEEDRRRLASALERWLEPEVGAVEPGSPAAKSGLEADDRIVSIDGEPIRTWYDVVAAIERRPDRETHLRVARDGREQSLVVVPDSRDGTDPVTGEAVDVGKVGIMPPFSPWVYEPMPFTDAVVRGARETTAVTALIVGFLADLVTGDVSPRSVGSIVTIGEASGQAAALGLETFLRFMALLSVNLAVLNLLPIPILDGGHLVFLAIEKVRGQALTIEQRLRWSNVGFLIVMGLMVWALSNDVLRLLGL